MKDCWGGGLGAPRGWVGPGPATTFAARVIASLLLASAGSGCGPSEGEGFREYCRGWCTRLHGCGYQAGEECRSECLDFVEYDSAYSEDFYALVAECVSDTSCGDVRDARLDEECVDSALEGLELTEQARSSCRVEAIANLNCGFSYDRELCEKYAVGFKARTHDEIEACGDIESCDVALQCIDEVF